MIELQGRAYIAENDPNGQISRMDLGIAAMSVLVIAMYRLLWRPSYASAERRTQLDAGHVHVDPTVQPVFDLRKSA